ncbi:MAG: hypothetical protein WD068_02075 [Candidatus Babeliales bacterium]
MSKRHTTSGYVMVLTLMIIGISVILVTQLFNRSRIYQSFMATIVNQQKAQELALAGVRIAQSQLFIEPKKAEAQSGRIGARNLPQEQDPDQQALEVILPILNRWQTFPLKRSIDGINGTIELFISAESGKINLNEIFDFSKKKFLGEGQPKGDYKKILETLLQGMPQGEELLKALGAYYRGRGYKLNDTTELFNNSVWAQQFKNDAFAHKKQDENKAVYLTDIFTIYTQGPTVNPWLVSHSLLQLLGIKELADGQEERIEKIKNALKGFKKLANWQTDWDNSVRFIYGKNFNSLPKTVDSLWNNQLELTKFSVLSRARVGTVAQSVFAILSLQKKGAQSIYMIEKVYWI